jgi:hypothetical protein
LRKEGVRRVWRRRITNMMLNIRIRKAGEAFICSKIFSINDNLAYKKESICRDAIELNNTGEHIFKNRCKWEIKVTK